MATRTMYRVICTKSGKITLSEYNWMSHQLVLDSIDVEFNDEMTLEQRMQLAKAMGEDVAKMEEEVKQTNANIHLRKEHIKRLLCIEYKAPPEHDGDGTLMDFDENVPF